MHDAPFLQQRALGRGARSTTGVYSDGHAAHGPRPAPLSDLRPVPDFEKQAEASGGHA